MGKKIKKSKTLAHVTYNEKSFLAPKSINSMAAIHCKIDDKGIAKVTISDCNNSIRIWNDLNDKYQVKEMVTKITNIQNTLEEFKKEVEIKLNRF